MPRIYAKYRELAEKTEDVHFVGRLATYKYYNMDQVVAQALATARKILGEVSPSRSADDFSLTRKPVSRTFSSGTVPAVRAASLPTH